MPKQPRIPHPDNALDLPHKFVALTRGQYARVDADLFEVVNGFTWFARFDKSTQSHYAARHAFQDGKWAIVYLHQFILELSGETVGQGLTIDHADGDSLNNLTSNLRLATRRQQQFNQSRRENNSSGFIGVYFERGRNRWRAQVTEPDGRRKNLGRFDNPYSAAWVRDKYAIEHYGEFAVTNNLADRRQLSGPSKVDRRK